jgi:anti-anti-sigma factor
MEILISQKQGRVPVTVLRPKDRINMGNTEELERSANEAIRQGAKYLVFDFADVPGITSAGLRTILSIAKKLGSDPSDDKKKSPYVKLANPSPEVLKVFKIAGFDLIFEIHADLQQAINSF